MRLPGNDQSFPRAKTHISKKYDVFLAQITHPTKSRQVSPAAFSFLFCKYPGGVGAGPHPHLNLIPAAQKSARDRSDQDPGSDLYWLQTAAHRGSHRHRFLTQSPKG